jgi:hypothetical protein
LIGATIAAAGVVALVAGVVFAVTRGSGTPATPVAGPSGGSAATSVSVSGSGSPSAPSTNGPATGFSGTAVFLQPDPNSGNMTVVRIVAGQSSSAVVINQADKCALMTATLSPDGTRVAYVTGGTSYNYFGDLYVASAQGGAPTLVASNVSCGGGWQPIWLDDSASLRIVEVDDGGQHCGRIVVSSGDFTELGGGWCGYLAFAPGGSYQARLDDSGACIVETGSGMLVRTVTPEINIPIGIAVKGISADGTYLAFGSRNTDPGVARNDGVLIDATTGQQLNADDLLGPGHDDAVVSGIAFVSGGGFVVDMGTTNGGDHTWYLLREPGTVLATLADPPIYFGMGDFVYLPN